MKMINITNIEAKKGEIHVTVQLRRYLATARDTNLVICKTEDVVHLLKEKSVKVGKCVKSTRLCNNRDKTCIGTWIFEREAPKRAPVKAAPAPTRNTVPKPTASKTLRKESSQKSRKNKFIDEKGKNINKILDND